MKIIRIRLPSYSLLQRNQGKLTGVATTVTHPKAKTGTSGGELFLGLQFNNATQAQLEQFTGDKINQVVEKIQEILTKVPLNHIIHTNITSNPTTQTAFLQKIRIDALAAAKASPIAYPP